jgi:hypothetical protein
MPICSNPSSNASYFNMVSIVPVKMNANYYLRNAENSILRGLSNTV